MFLNNLRASLVLINAKKGWSEVARKKSALVRAAKKKIKTPLKRVVPGSPDYKKLKAVEKEVVLNHELKRLDKLGSVYRSVKTKGFKNLLDPKIEANKSIGRFEGMARAYRKRAAGLKGKQRRIYLHMAINCIKQAHVLHDATKGRWPSSKGKK